MLATAESVGTAASEIDTPVVIINLDILERNIERVQHYLASHNISNRPHVKTHKMPVIAHRQISAGAVGIACQKLGEAEVMADAGLKDILVTFNIVGRQKLNRLVALAKRTRVTVTADHLTIAKGLSQAAWEAEVTIPVLVECDTGQHRCGVETPAAAAMTPKSWTRLRAPLPR